ncbi:MAG: CpsD/CapB family tyrosine-protein kinase [Clostridiales bacterium]|nr:CpsD/CapB family tyrosine-protein kinase [Clostridiales bacterium]
MDSCKIDIITGHFGSGKTEFAINYSMHTAKAGKKVLLIDLDIVNPYFKTAEVKDVLEAMGVEVIVPNFAGTGVDVPSLPSNIYRVFDDPSYDKVIFDVGGDDLGAMALGQYKTRIQNIPYDMFYVINTKRPLSSTQDQIIDMLHSIESSSRLKVSKLINNTNLSYETNVNDIMEGQRLIERISKKMDIPIGYIAGTEDVLSRLPVNMKDRAFELKLYMQPIWDQDL